MGNKIEYIDTLCECGCKHIYPKLKNPIKPVKFKIESYRGNDKNKGVLSIKRLSDNTIFRLGDNVQGMSALGDKGSKCIIFKIQYVEEGIMKGFLQIHCWVIGYCGMITFKNEKEQYNGNNTSSFKLLKIINTK